MRIFLKSVRIVSEAFTNDSDALFDILIDGDRLQEIGKELTPPNDALVINHKNLFVSSGWLDLSANYNDPGNESMEDLESGIECAKRGGFTAVGVLPNTNPIIQDKKGIKYIKNRFDSVVELLPIGAVTMNCEGSELTEMLDMHYSGAVAFSDGEKTLWNSDILYKSLLYLKPINGLLINQSQDKWLSMHGLVHEGSVSTSLGLPGIPVEAEEISIQRDLKLVELSGGRLHFSRVSSQKGLDLIILAKKQGLNVTCDIASYQLIFSDEDLLDFNTNLKVNPPLRSKMDRTYLKENVINGNIDCVVSHHLPLDTEHKHLEFDLSSFGMINQQTCFSSLIEALGTDNLNGIIRVLSSGPNQVIGRKKTEIKVGEIANLTLFDPFAEWEFNVKNNLSKSNNSPFLNKKMKGKALGIINKGKNFLSDELTIDG